LVKQVPQLFVFAKNLGEENPITAAELFLTVKIQKAGNTAGYLKCLLKPSIEEDSELCVLWHGIVQGHRMIGKLGSSTPCEGQKAMQLPPTHFSS